jgi:hypothetical protein
MPGIDRRLHLPGRRRILFVETKVLGRYAVPCCPVKAGNGRFRFIGRPCVITGVIVPRGNEHGFASGV